MSGRRRPVHPLLHALGSPVGRAVLALALVLLAGVAFNAEGSFFQWETHRGALRSMSVFGILACGMTLVILTGGIDLAVGSLLALVAVVFATLAMHWGWHPAAAIMASLLVGAACGMGSGAVVAFFRIQPFIATLAMMVFARGLAKFVSGGKKVSTAVQQADGSYTYIKPPQVFDWLDATLLNGNIAIVTVVFLGCVGLTWVIQSRLTWGRYLYAVGGNEEAARLSGVPIIRTKLLAYMMSGFFAAVAGVAHAAQARQGDSEAGIAYELDAIAMVVIGGTSLMGGRGGIGLTLLGVLIIGYVRKILSINGWPEPARLMITGAIIIIAVLAQRRRTG